MGVLYRLEVRLHDAARADAQRAVDRMSQAYGDMLLQALKKFGPQLPSSADFLVSKLRDEAPFPYTEAREWLEERFFDARVKQLVERSESPS